MSDVMLSCGCRANATDGNGQPSCAIHAGLVEPNNPVPSPNVAGRTARCSCGRTEPSSKWKTLAFFEFRGEGSPKARESCKNCGYHQIAHRLEVMAKNAGLKCSSFEPRGALEFDSFYCGCRGWD